MYNIFFTSCAIDVNVYDSSAVIDLTVLYRSSLVQIYFIQCFIHVDEQRFACWCMRPLFSRNAKENLIEK